MALTGSFSAANENSQEFWAVGPFSVAVAMSGVNRVDLQTKMPSGAWVAGSTEQFTESGVTYVDMGGFPARCRIYCTTYAAAIEYAVMGKILADELSAGSDYWSFALEAADPDDLLQENGDYLLQEAA